MKIRIAALIVLTTILFQACKTDFDINAPWKESAIVYGILNQNDTIHYIKVNKACIQWFQLKAKRNRECL